MKNDQYNTNNNKTITEKTINEHNKIINGSFRFDILYTSSVSIQNYWIEYKTYNIIECLFIDCLFINCYC